VEESVHTTSEAFLRALRDGGVSHVFANLGNDHPGIIEAYARARRDGVAEEFPELIVCPHESVALSAAYGHAQVSGQAQAVVVHAACGTQNLSRAYGLTVQQSGSVRPTHRQGGAWPDAS
jgi:acetolactate synthase-1/2/3 large subunit